MKLIMNADDFGLSRGVNYGVAEACCSGVVRSASLLANADAFLHAVDLAREIPGLGVGVHLTLTSGRPLAAGRRTIVDGEGAFFCLSDLMERADRLDPDEIEREFAAQVDKVRGSGIRPTHLDTHHHVHMLGPIFPVFAALAAHCGLPARMRAEDRDRPGAPSSPEAHADGFYGAELSEELLIDILLAHRDRDVVEVACHPGYVDEELLSRSSYALPRARELAILCSPAVRECVRRHRFALADYRCLHTPQLVRGGRPA